MDMLLSIRSKADGSLREVKRDVGNGLVIGRGAEHGILLDGPGLSREHLVLTSDGAETYVTDLSSNGTWLNGARLSRSIRNRIRREDVLEVPGYVLTLKPDAEPEKISSAALPAAQPLQMVVDPNDAVPETAEKSGATAFLGPVFGFLGSFTFLEKTMALVAVGGLLLLYAYMGS